MSAGEWEQGVFQGAGLAPGHGALPLSITLLAPLPPEVAWPGGFTLRTLPARK